MHRWGGETGFPKVITVFSAPNYCDCYNNKGAVIKFDVNITHTTRTMHSTFNNSTTKIDLMLFLILWISSLGLCLSWPKRLLRCFIIY